MCVCGGGGGGGRVQVNSALDPLEDKQPPRYIYKGCAKSSVTNRLPWFYPRYILKCFTALEWCVEQLMIPIYFVQIAFQLTQLFQTEIDAVIYTDQFTCYIGTRTRRLKFIAILNAALGLI